MAKINSVSGRLQTRYNSWTITEGHTATFTLDDFESWWLAAKTREDKLSPTDMQALYDNFLYLAESEEREITHTASELRSIIRSCADEWNARIDREANNS
jgi:hypothetical protein